MRLCGIPHLQRPAGERDALLDQRSDFLGLFQRRDDTAFGLRAYSSSNSASRSVRNSALAKLRNSARCGSGYVLKYDLFFDVA
jgi:hypothetical protein